MCSSDLLTRILRTYGEERYARRIAERIVAERDVAPWTTSARLVEVVRSSIPMRVQQSSPGNPAKRTFQALRIEVNDELAVLRRAIPESIEAIGVGGRGAGDLDGVASENIVALCDVDENALNSAAGRFPHAEKFFDYRQLLERKDLEAVVIGTPDHHHAPPTVRALRRGLHVYCEKPQIGRAHV